MKKIISFITFLIVSNTSFCQNYEGKIDAININGLHKIELSPEVRSLIKNNINNIRILDSNKNEVPYLVFAGNNYESKQENLDLISKEAIKNVSTSVVISNKNSKNIDGLILEIANTNVSKKYNIYGSNDNLQWYGLINNQTISNLSDSNKTSVEYLFSFPLNNYKYLKFEFIDKNSLPINVLNASLSTNSVLVDEQLKISDFHQKTLINKNKKQTLIEISFVTPQIIDQIKFNISYPNFYLRDARILVDKTRMIKKREENYQEIISYFQLNSSQNNQFRIPNLYTKQFVIEIDNQDNPELKINKIELFQSQESLIADLKVNENYTIYINDSLKSPNYDLAKSGIDLKIKFPTVSINNIQKINTKVEIQTSKNFWQTPAFMWICIIIVVLILTYFSFAMIKDMKNK